MFVCVKTHCHYIPITPLHIAEGALPLWECLMGYAITLGVIAYTMRRLRLIDVPKLALLSALFFVVSFIHIDVGPSSVHPLLIGLIGILLGPHSYPGISIALLLQALIAGHGGITTWGVNSIDMGLPALASYAIFKAFSRKAKSTKALASLSFFIGAFAVVLAVLLTVAALAIANPAYLTPALALIALHTPLVFIEGGITSGVVTYLMRHRPDLLKARL